MEQLCFYHNTAELIGGAAFRDYICTNCHRKISYGSTNIPVRCTQCAIELNKCQRCDWQLDIKIGVEIKLCIDEYDGRKRKKIFRECRNQLKYGGWKITNDFETDTRLYLTIRNERIDAQLYLPTDYMLQTKLYKI